MNENERGSQTFTPVRNGIINKGILKGLSMPLLTEQRNGALCLESNRLLDEYVRGRSDVQTFEKLRSTRKRHSLTIFDTILYGTRCELRLYS